MTKNITAIQEQVNGFIAHMTVDEKISLLSTSQSAIERLGIREYKVGGEGAHGVVDREGGITTSFPQPLGLSQTWNPDLLKEVGTAIGNEARIKYLQSNKTTWLTLWAPTIDMERDPRWGRNDEAYGEDPYLTGRLSAELIKGMQGDDPTWLRMAAAPKHFYGNNNEEKRESSSNSIDLRNREEYYLKAFEPAFKEAKAQSMMTAYNGINGVPAMQHEDIEQVVRQRWDMDGFVVCDGGALTLNVESYHYYDTYEEALADALKKGIDCFVDDKEKVETAARKALDKHLITEEDITRAVKRILTVRGRLGHFEDVIPFDEVSHSLLAGEEHAELVRKVTAEQAVLLKNQDSLPLSEKQKVHLTGPLADVWFRDWYGGYPPHEMTIKEALMNKFPENSAIFSPSHDEVSLKINDAYLAVKEDKLVAVSSEEEAAEFIFEDWDFGSHLLKEKQTGRYIQYDDQTNTFRLHKTEVYDWFVKENWVSENKKDWHTWDNHPIGITSEGFIGAVKESIPIELVTKKEAIKEAATAAKEADVSVVILGNHPMLNGKETMDRPGMTLPAHQLAMVKELYAVNPNVVVVIVGSYPFEIDWLHQHIPGILFTTHGSQELGTSLSDILFGKEAPTGKLSQTWYKQIEKALPPIRDYDIIKGNRTYRYTNESALYPFGHGLTYGKVSILSFSMDTYTWRENEEVTVTVELQNTANQEVTETVQVYATLTPAQYIKLPEKQLVAFLKTPLKPGEKKKVTLKVKTSELGYFDVAWNKWVFPKAEGTLSIGFSSATEHSLSFNTIGEVRLERDFKEPVHAERYDDYSRAFITSDSTKEKVVCIGADGWLAFKNVRLKQASSYIEIVYSADKSGELRLYTDDQLKHALSVEPYKAGNQRSLVLAIPDKNRLDMYLSPTTSIQLKTIREQ
ncbi:glycoside hydrolase family 3 protein [Alkalibacterium iburiense]|uniref:Glycoside hydrolase family 3 protein n=1 Tax=Alkalibacterium iburiense TaxID=290589 RepID=A0ABN0X340_9LACT